MRRGDLAVGVFPPIHVLEEDGKYIAIRGNRRLFLHRVLATLGVVSSVRVQLFRKDDASMKQERWEERLSCFAPKWQRSMSSLNGGR